MLWTALRFVIGVAVLWTLWGTVRLLLSGWKRPAESHLWIRRALFAGIGGFVLLHLEAVFESVVVHGELNLLGARVTRKDYAFGAHHVVERSWWGTVCLLVGILSAAALVLAERGRRGRALGGLVGVAGIATLSWAFVDEGEFLRRWEPPPAVPIARVDSPGGYVPPEALISDSHSTTAFWTRSRPALSFLLVPGGALVLLGLIEAGRSSGGRRPWRVPFTDALLLLGVAAALFLAILRIESAFLERADVLVRLGPKAPAITVLLDDFLRISAPSAAIAWVGLALLALGMMDRRRLARGVDA